MKRLPTRIGILVTVAFSFAFPAHGLCFARDLTKPAGWDWDRSVKTRTFSIEDEFTRALVVSTVKVTSVRTLREAKDDPEGVTAHSYRVQLVHQFKGPRIEEITLYNQSSSARFDMEVGKEYLAFIQSVGKHSVIDSCGWSDELALAMSTMDEAQRLASLTQEDRSERP